MNFIDELKRRNVFRVGIAYMVASWLIIQVGDILFESIGAPPWVIQAMFIILAAGLIVALIFAWAFELTPEGVKREKEVDRTESITHNTGRKLDFAIIGVLVLALGYFVVDKFWLTPASTAEQTEANAEAAAIESAPETIAVLPFIDMSPNGDNEYFSDGLTEELLNILAKIQELRVAGRTSSFAFKGKDEDLRSIGKKLNVKTILEGSVRKDQNGKKVRITAQLVNVEDGFHIWSETYDRDLNDIFAIQDEIAHEVAKALRITLLGEDEVRLASREVTDLNAYELYLQGLKNLNEFSFASLNKAKDLFEQSVKLDPEYIPAKNGLANAMLSLVTTGAFTREESIPIIEPLLNSILEEDPKNADALVSLSAIKAFQKDFPGAKDHLNQALNANPRNIEALRGLGMFAFRNGDADAATEYLKEAERLDPYSVSVLWNLCMTRALMVRTEQAILYCERIGEVQPENPMQYYGPGMALEFNGDLAQGLVYLQKAVELDPDDYELTAGAAKFWLDMGDVEQAEIWLKKSEEIGAGQPVPLVSRLFLHEVREQFGMATDLASRAIIGKLENRQRTTDIFEDWYLRDLVQKGEFEQGIEYFREKIPQVFEDPPVFELNVSDGADDLFEIGALYLTQDPNSEQGQLFLDAAQEKRDLTKNSFIPWVHALNLASVAALKGDKAEAINYLFEAFELNHRTEWRHTLHVPFYLAGLQNEPEFKRLISLYEEDMDRQRDLAYELLGMNK